jgi:GNAT superfamily N-acetyltransferase
MSTLAELVIRPVQREDLPALHRLVHALAVYEKLEHLVVSTPADFERELFGPDARIECVLAEVAGEPVGFALWFHNFSTFLGRRGLYLEDLFVIPEQRGRGYGKALLRHLAQIAVERDCGRFEWSVLDWNAPSIAFYEAMGATVLPDWRIVRMTGDTLRSFGEKR